jgi:peptidyl-prolyl cis-trans isomerase D
MLESLRNWSRGWVAAILIFLLVGSFGIWGVQDWMNVSSTPKIATVGETDITPEQFQREFTDYLAKFQRETKQELSTAQAKALNFDRIALDEMLTREALLAKAKDMGLSVTTSFVTRCCGRSWAARRCRRGSSGLCRSSGWSAAWSSMC